MDHSSATTLPIPPRRWLYGAGFRQFLDTDPDHILGELVRYTGADVDHNQTNAWLEQIRLLKILELPAHLADTAKLYFEYTIPRLGRRVDVILIVGHALFVIEFKIGERHFTSSALDQAWDYALDLKHFHEASHGLSIAPLVVATEAPQQPIEVQATLHDDGLVRPVCTSGSNLSAAIDQCLSFFDAPDIDAQAWEHGRYLPTPSIIEAARALYAGHSVDSISRSDAGAQNLAVTSRAVDQVIEQARKQGRKAICFVTGVPGAGKTLVGLDVATRHMDKDDATYSVFLSGNGPLVAVLREALARDSVERAATSGETLLKGKARQEVSAFIQNVHHFRDDCLKDSAAPPEHVVLFDEAQRAWTLEKTASFMARKKGLPNFDKSEPAFLISCLDRHQDWAVVICLVGGGQEINTGEAGIREWLEAILTHFTAWDVHLPPQLNESEYGSRDVLEQVLTRPDTYPNPALHLATSMRSFRAESLSKFVREVLDLEIEAARATLLELQSRYPIRITRNLPRAKQWLCDQARGTERYGIVVSSQAQRLKPHAIDVRVKTDPVRWFLDGKEDVRSSYYLEDVSTEFQVQGLELDWTCVVWDGDLRHVGDAWSHHEFKGTRWNRINKQERRAYLKNAYRVLLTRARQGMVIVIPEGSANDPTRAAGYYDGTYDYLRLLGIPHI
ncbi:DUF2075 domain-containing protein [Pseudoxanthomonas sp.]|jgi:Uncharacterized conserved protein (DUF2075).|uniref:DUF2075 domain-containing protein n=1 Tax=Pseudoxanthomonas sp. TaxID=1871049 RepID=UPI002FE03126